MPKNLSIDIEMRSAEFDKEKVLRAAMNAFMAKGYNKTSMQDLKIATGLHPGSIYCAFENKRGLLLAALEQYNKDRAVEFQQFFQDKNKMLVGLKKYLAHVVNECISCDPQKACLSQKALSELAEQDEDAQQLITMQLKHWQNGFTDVFKKAQQNDEVSAERLAQHRAESLVMGIYGLRIYAHTHPEPEILQRLAEQLFNDVCH